MMKTLEEDLKRIKDLDVMRGKAIGRISLWLDSITETESDSDLNKKLQKLDIEINELEQKVDSESELEKLNHILSIINLDLTQKSEKVDLEHNVPVRFDIENITLLLDKKEGAVPFKKVGSAENHLYYHLITLMAFHKYFIENQRPIPQFIFLDQPSHVYFPRGKYDDKEGNIEQEDDWNKVVKLFTFIKEYLQEVAPNLQIIITDHADLKEEFYQESVVEKWWSLDKALIPQEWINEAS